MKLPLHDEVKMRKYLAIVAVPFLLSCNEGNGDLSDRVLSQPSAISSSETTTRDYCNEPPNIGHLFDAYNGLREVVEVNGLIDPSVKRMYGAGEREYNNSKKIHASCKNECDYLLATQLAINSVNFMAEALAREEELKK